jgi:hypothetical protein
VYERRAYLDALVPCLKEAACSSAGIAECERSARTGIEPTTATSAYCQKRTEKDHACGVATDLARCIDEHKKFEDAVFPALEPCLDDPCDRYRRCIVGVYANGPR